MSQKHPISAPPDIAALARDWVAMWQSELTAMAADREWQEGWAAMLALWAGAASMAINLISKPGHEQPRPAASAGAAAAASASGPGGDADEQRLGELHRRIAELEERLASIERREG